MMSGTVKNKEVIDHLAKVLRAPRLPDRINGTHATNTAAVGAVPCLAGPVPVAQRLLTELAVVPARQFPLEVDLLLGT